MTEMAISPVLGKLTHIRKQIHRLPLHWFVGTVLQGIFLTPLDLICCDFILICFLSVFAAISFCLLACRRGGPVYRPRSTGLTAPKIATLLQHNTTQHYNTTQHNTTTEHNRTEHNTTQHNTTQQVRSGN